MKAWILLIASLISVSIDAHSGRTDSSGGHNCSQKSQNKGLCSGYHYHNKGIVKTTFKEPTNKVAPAPIVGEYSTLYERTDWNHWIDKDGDCQNTRVEILIDTSTLPVTLTKSKCSVVTGTWYDPYSDKIYTSASDLDLDHVVPLKWAHGHGGSVWTKSEKEIFANDETNLLLVQDSLNAAKGAKSPDEWMPPNQKFRCAYVAKFDDIVTRYKLNYIPSEKRIIQRMLDNCNKK